MNKKGFTLIELMVVIAIVAMLATLALTGYHSTREKVKVENEIKALYGNLQNAKMRAFAEKRMWGLVWSSVPFTSYEMRYDTDGDDDITDSGGYNSTGTVSDLQYPINRTTSLNYVTFKASGLSNNELSFYVDSAPDAEYDCVKVTQTRIKMGKWNATSNECVER